MTVRSPVALLARLVLLLLFAAFIAALVVVGVAALLATVLWSLLRGRKPAVFHIYSQFRNASRRFNATQGGFAVPPESRATTEVVDVDAREVDGTGKLR